MAKQSVQLCSEGVGFIVCAPIDADELGPFKGARDKEQFRAEQLAIFCWHKPILQLYFKTIRIVTINLLHEPGRAIWRLQCNIVPGGPWIVALAN